VTLGLHIRIVSRIDGEILERDFPRFPIRIGRNPLNDLQLEHGFVSQFHALLELLDGQIVLRDLGSTNGTHVPGLGRVPPNQSIVLADCGNEFTIHTLDMHATLTTVNEDQASTSQRKPLEVSRFLMEVPKALAAIDSEVPDFGTSEQHRAQFAAYRWAWSELSRELFRWLATVPPNQRAQALIQVRHRFAGIENEPDFGRLLADAGAPRPNLALHSPSDSNTGQLETIAVEGLKELAYGFCPEAGPLETADHLVCFLERIRALLEVFFKCFLPLREGHRQFESDMALRRPSSNNPPNSDHPVVETAQTPHELASALLDWHISSGEGPMAIESAFADIMVHQVALINGVMHGVKSLLQELSPSETERSAQSEGGLGLGPYRYKSLWKIYERRYSDIADEEKQIFARLFG
jgi:type VI secretion system protein ImpI